VPQFVSEPKRVLDVLNGTGSCADTTAIAKLARIASRANIAKCEGVEGSVICTTLIGGLFIWIKRPRALVRSRGASEVAHKHRTLAELHPRMTVVAGLRVFEVF
jgi:hypothetical protein